MPMRNSNAQRAAVNRIFLFFSQSNSSMKALVTDWNIAICNDGCHGKHSSIATTTINTIT